MRFVDNVSIGGTKFTIIAANTVTINNGKIVTVNGAKADVYTGFDGNIPNSNFTGSGDNGTITGTFGSADANSLQPIGNASPLTGRPAAR